MATTPQVIRALALLIMMHPATFDRFMRELRAAGLLPIGPRGGGKNAQHFEAEHLAYVLLSLVVTQPGEAVEAAKILAAMRCIEYDAQGNKVGETTLLEYLAQVLLRAAEYYRAKARGEDVGPWPPLPVNIEMSLGARRLVTVDWDGRGQRRLEFAPEGEYSTRFTISRWTMLHQPLLQEVALLLADTLNHHDAIASSTEAKTKTPETGGASNTSAPAPTHTDTTDRSRTRETGSLTTPEAMRVCVNPQGLMDSRVGHFLLATGDDHHAYEWFRPPPSHR